MLSGGEIGVLWSEGLAEMMLISEPAGWALGAPEGEGISKMLKLRLGAGKALDKSCRGWSFHHIPIGKVNGWKRVGLSYGGRCPGSGRGWA